MGLAAHNTNGYVIRVGENALMQMCLSSLEAYCVSHTGSWGHKTGLETYGLLFGHEAGLPDGRTLYCVDFVSVDTSAERERDFCRPNHRALLLKRDILTSFFPQHEFLGDFHSHPYREASGAATRNGRGCRFSEQDYLHVIGNADFWMLHGYRVGMVLSLALLGRRSGKGHRQVDGTTLEFTFGNYRLHLKGYVAALDDDEEGIVLMDRDNEVQLSCPAITGLGKQLTEFGKGVKRPRLRHVCGSI